jgi:hypothetical protein
MNEGFNDETASMISNTTLAEIILRNTDTTNLQANVFIETPLPINVTPNVTAPLATHVQSHLPTPAAIDTHGRSGSPFINDGGKGGDS